MIGDNYFIAGGAGFIGATLAHALLARSSCCRVVVYDNFSNGREEFFNDIINNPRLAVVRGDIKDSSNLIRFMSGCDVIYHFASNADIAKAAEDPTVDFWEGTYLTQCILEAMRITGRKRIIYASGSGVYGDWKNVSMFEDMPLRPVTSPYGASKLAGEGLIAAYSHLFDITARIYRFANVIGKNQTHGIITDLINKLKINPDTLSVLGDGEQSKTYVHVDDVVSGILLTEGRNFKHEVYNISSETFITVKGIVDIVISEAMSSGLLKKLPNINYGSTPGGWAGDIPIVRLDARKIKKEGWTYQYTSNEAVEKTVKDLLND